MQNMKTEYSVEFLQNVAAEVRTNKRWDNGSEDLISVTDLCADLRECFEIQCHTDGRLISLD